MRSPAVNASKVVLESLAAIAISAATASPLAPPAVTPARSGHGYWLEAIPESLEEAALRDALARSAFGGGPGPAEGLARVTAAHPGTVASGLAQLAAGFALLDAGKEAEAIAYLTHPDIQKTALTSQAWLALGRAQEPEGADKATAAYLKAAEADPTGPTACMALLRAADVWAKEQAAKAASALDLWIRTRGVDTTYLPKSARHRRLNALVVAIMMARALTNRTIPLTRFRRHRSSQSAGPATSGPSASIA